MYLFALTGVLASFFIMSVALAGIPMEESDRDPDSGFSPPPGVSWSYAWMYAVYNPQAQTYSNHQFSHDKGIQYVGGLYKYEPTHDADVDHPWCWTQMYYRDNSSMPWQLDTFAQVNW